MTAVARVSGDANREWLEPLPPDARDPDVVRAKQPARRADSQSQRQRRSG